MAAPTDFTHRFPVPDGLTWRQLDHNLGRLIAGYTSHIEALQPEIDAVLLDYLQEGRVTPAYTRDRILEEGVLDAITAQYCQQRLARFEEHGHVRNLFETGLYEVVTDPQRWTRNHERTSRPLPYRLTATAYNRVPFQRKWRANPTTREYGWSSKSDFTS